MPPLKPKDGADHTRGSTPTELLGAAPSRPPKPRGPGKPANKLAQNTSRWQRVARYAWDKNRGRG